MKGKAFVDGELACEAIVLCKIMGKIVEQKITEQK
jgi:hypothetical protein